MNCPHATVLLLSTPFSQPSATPLTIAQLPRDVVFLAGTVLEQAESIGAVPGVVGVPAQGIQGKDEMEARAISKVIEFV